MARLGKRGVWRNSAKVVSLAMAALGSSRSISLRRRSRSRRYRSRSRRNCSVSRSWRSSSAISFSRDPARQFPCARCYATSRSEVQEESAALAPNWARWWGESRRRSKVARRSPIKASPAPGAGTCGGSWCRWPGAGGSIHPRVAWPSGISAALAAAGNVCVGLGLSRSRANCSSRAGAI